MASINYTKWQVVLVDLNPVKGSEISKVRPCLIISPNAVNKYLHTVIVAPLTFTIRHIPSRLASNIDGKQGEMCFDQMRSIDKSRIVKALGVLESKERKNVNVLLSNMFSEL